MKQKLINELPTLLTQKLVMDLLARWGGLIGCGPVKEIWRLALLCVMWCIWHERNALIFEDVKISVVELQKYRINLLHMWIAAHHRLDVPTLVDFLNLSSIGCSYFIITYQKKKKKKKKKFMNLFSSSSY
jgi:hypothetical protein